MASGNNNWGFYGGLLYGGSQGQTQQFQWNNIQQVQSPSGWQQYNIIPFNAQGYQINNDEYIRQVRQLAEAQVRRASARARGRGHTNFLRFEEKCKALQEESLEDEDMKEGYVGMLNTFLIGCDPEFVALNGSGAQINLADHFAGDGEIGYDHGGRVGEFRPAPTKGTYALTKRLQRLIKSDTVERVHAAKLRAGARAVRDTLGGHVHFGFPTPLRTDARIAALDRVTAVLENLDILPSEESKVRRANGSGYGRFGDVRDSRGHLEYRTMASWLTDPRVAYLCLTAAKLAACDAAGTVETLKQTASFNDLIEWFRRYRTKDTNARRALERVLSLGHAAVRVYPDVDFRERWRELGL